jgi:hypothetical protein
MAPRRAAAVSAASSISQAAGPSTPVQANASRSVSAKQANQQQPSNNAKAPAAMPVDPVQHLSPIVLRLRKMWKFAAVCQFLFTFDEAFGMSGFETEVRRGYKCALMI